MSCPNVKLDLSVAPCEPKDFKVEDFFKSYGKLLRKDQLETLKFLSINFPDFILNSFEMDPPAKYKRSYTATFIFGAEGEGKYKATF